MELLLLLLCFIVLAQILGSKGCLREERTALLDIKAFLNAYNDSTLERRLSTWVNDPTSDCCKWNHVKCDPFSNHVVKLYLQDLHVNPHSVLLYNNHSMEVSIDFSLFQNFKELRSLNLSQGGFQRLIHTEVLGNLSNLEVLILRKNFLLSGTKPIQGFCELKKIRVLDLSYNSFHGHLPRCFGNLTSLRALDLSKNFLSGDIPTSAFARLNSVEYLSLLFNYFEGSFPLSLFANNSQLKVLALEMAADSEHKFQVDTEVQGVPWVPSFQLEVLHMPNCKLNAPQRTLPSFLSYQHDLQYLDLSNNNLVGVFPNWLLVNNSNLRSLILHHNMFTGPFELPTDVDQNPHPLYDFQISNNKMAGELPKHIGRILPNLIYLNMSGNGFDGSIPNSLGNMSNLYALDLSRNNFSGEVPDSLWTSCASLGYLKLSHNSLWGQLFPSPLNMSQLVLLHLDNNYFNGTLQHGILKLPYLEALDISNNKLWGTIPNFISEFSSLRVIYLSENNFTGALPRELCKLDLYCVHLSDNKFSGSIPSCYVNLESLIGLYLQSNNLVGSIPQLWRTSNSLATLDLRDNNLFGSIPHWFYIRLPFLRALLLGGNHFQGHLPEELCQLKRISFLDLSRNNFTGNLPSCFNNVSFGAWTVRYIQSDFSLIPSDSWYHYPHLDLDLFFEQSWYYIPTESGGVIEFRTKASLLSYSGDIQRYMSGIDLSCNQLTGKIPYTIGYLDDLRALNLSHNHFSGSIPKSFHKLEKIESLDLSNNKLFGQIPFQLQDLNSLAVFNVSYNNLSGTVPNKGQFGTFDESSYIGNPYLFLNNSNRGTTILPPSNPTSYVDGDDSVIDFTSFYWSFVASYVTVLLMFAAILCINPRWRRAWFSFIETCLSYYVILQCCTL
ncbi:hypothetical protein L6164_000245 [Bauhinia variegata]|uniref:Uncharacterized protein n=1 Tax=Bauhinia variegata TaxID=167791 RepID=A0ACB9Q6J3_BAUVA|nr:hypothetical protein L6164_000245 [Bauhinia variegata]